jgi:hypothetical protein
LTSVHSDESFFLLLMIPAFISISVLKSTSGFDEIDTRLANAGKKATITRLYE